MKAILKILLFFTFLGGQSIYGYPICPKEDESLDGFTEIISFSTTKHFMVCEPYVIHANIPFASLYSSDQYKMGNDFASILLYMLADHLYNKASSIEDKQRALLYFNLSYDFAIRNNVSFDEHDKRLKNIRSKGY